MLGIQYISLGRVTITKYMETCVEHMLVLLIYSEK